MATNSEHHRFLVEKIAQLKSESDKMLLVAGIDQQRVEIHRVILAAISEYFARNLGGNYDEVEVILDGVDGRFLREIVSFSYTGNIDIHAENIEKLLTFAKNYEFTSLYEKCTTFCRQQLSTDDCIKWFLFADKSDMNGLRQNSFQMICKNFEAILNLCELNFELFKEIIATDENMANEEIIFDQLVKWIQHDELGRAGHANELLQCIRLKHIPDKALVEKVMIFCQKYNIVGYTDNECKERLQNPRPLYLSRFARTRSVFEIHEKGTTVIVRTYDPNRNCWRKEITITNELPQKFYGIVFCMGKLYIIGGRTENGTYLKDVDMFNFESKTRTDLPEMNVARGHLTAIAIDQFIYVFGGYNGITLKDCERFNTISGKWEKRKPMHHAHHSLTAAAVNGYIFVADGFSSNKGCCCKVERYDPINDEWTKIANLLDPLFEGILIEWKGLLYAVGVNVERVKRYDCKQNIWVTPDIAVEKDEILSSFRWLRLINFDYSREQVIVERKNFFKRLCAPNSTEVTLADFSHNLVLHCRSPL